MHVGSGRGRCGGTNVGPRSLRPLRASAFSTASRSADGPSPATAGRRWADIPSPSGRGGGRAWRAAFAAVPRRACGIGHRVRARGARRGRRNVCACVHRLVRAGGRGERQQCARGMAAMRKRNGSDQPLAAIRLFHCPRCMPAHAAVAPPSS